METLWDRAEREQERLWRPVGGPPWAVLREHDEIETLTRDVEIEVQKLLARVDKPTRHKILDEVKKRLDSYG